MTKKSPKTSKRNSRLTSVAAPLGGLLTALLVVFLFNAQYYVAQVIFMLNPPQSTAAVAQQIKSEPKREEAQKVDPAPKVIIPGIGVDAPVVYGMDSTVEWQVQVALRSGVLHFAGTPNPGEPGNGVYIGHSSGAPWAPGSYKFVFTALEHVNVDDVFYLNHDGKQYAYQVISKRVVSPTDTSVIAGDNTPTATLITCTPVGTSKNRMVILGKQIHPAPVVGTAKQQTIRPSALPGN